MDANDELTNQTMCIEVDILYIGGFATYTQLLDNV